MTYPTVYVSSAFLCVYTGTVKMKQVQVAIDLQGIFPNPENRYGRHGASEPVGLQGSFPKPNTESDRKGNLSGRELSQTRCY